MLPNANNNSPSIARTMRRRAQRCLERGDMRKALQLLRESAAREPCGATYCWLAHALLAAHKREDALSALRQALFCFRHEDTRPRARTVARLILKLDPGDCAARKKAA
jgi:uncharacterized protein HemY